MNEISTHYYPVDLYGGQTYQPKGSEKTSRRTQPIIGTENAINADKTARDLNIETSQYPTGFLRKIDFDNIYAQRSFGFMGFRDPLSKAIYSGQKVYIRQIFNYQPKQQENPTKYPKGFSNIDFTDLNSPRSFGFTIFDDPLSQILLQK